jgi:hypothetical protein
MSTGMSLVWVALLLALASHAAAQQCVQPAPGACTVQQNIPQSCVELACVPDDASHSQQGDPGHCKPCDTRDADLGAEQCGGRACLANGHCDVGIVISPPQPIRPKFHLLIVDVTVPLVDARDARYKPIVGAGYLHQRALRSTEPVRACDGGWTSTVPSLYLDLGASLAFGGNAQNAFANAGLSWHLAGHKLAISHVSGGALYQRVGASIWELSDSTENGDRLGPYAAVGFLYNLFVRASYVWAVSHDNPHDHGAFLLSAVYMRDLIDDLVPDRFTKHIPSKYRGH